MYYIIKTYETEPVVPTISVQTNKLISFLLLIYLSIFFQGALTYFGIGFGINMARLVIPKITRPWKVFSSIRSHHLNLGLFFGTYIGIYRVRLLFLLIMV